jgi:ABC-type glycerol-3-phosphate transport system substrate-binding protein
MRIRIAAALATALLLAACGSSEPETVTLGQTLTMVDAQGRTAGKVVFTPLGTGSVYDAKGNLIGNIVHP